ncbi:MAG: hypothetical protein AMXMBFR53_44920 [Gemmatimonadota bacterium]
MGRGSRGWLLAMGVLAAPVAGQQGGIASVAEGAGGAGAAPAPPSLAAAARRGEVRVDGHLDEAAWADARVFTDFIQRDPDEGQPASERTEVRILVDGDALYVAARMWDADAAAIQSQLARRDNAGNTDFIQVNLDANHDHLTAYLFRVNPSGTVMDVFADGPTNLDSSWDPVWEARTSVDDEGWSAEMRIPFSQLRFVEGNDTWGLQIIRGIQRRFEFSYFAFIPRTENSGADRYGHLTGMSVVEEARRVELLPYVLARSEELNFAEGDPFHGSVDHSATVGLDAKVGLTSELVLDATVNPDFGQVELDPAVVNLTAFETFFPERRPFFVEGADAFRFGATGADLNQLQNNVFYSRRIGRAPVGGVGGTGAAFGDVPDQTTILGAGKVSGRVAGWRVGILDAVTSREEARIQDAEGVQRTLAVEPRANYLAARARRDFRQGNSSVGVLATSATRSFGDGDGSLPDLLHEQATVGGLDLSHTWNRRSWFLNGFVAGSRVSGTPEALLRTQASSARYYQRPDAGHVSLDPTRTSLGGYAAALAVGRTGGEHWLGSVLLQTESPGWEVNDLGFDPRTDVRQVSGLLTYRETQPGKVLRNYRIDLTGNGFWNFDGDHTGSTFALGSIVQFNDFTSASARVFRSLGTVDDQLTRGGPLGYDPPQWIAATSVSTDPRRSWQGSVSVSRRWDEEDTRQFNVSGYLSLRPRPSVQVTLQPSVQVLTEQAQFLGSIGDAAYTPTFGRRYLFGTLEQTVTSLTARLDWTFTPRLSLQLFAQPLVGAGRFTGFKELAAPGVWSYREYGGDAGTLVRDGDRVVLDPDGPGRGPGPLALSPDFNLRTLRGNAVLRWEYRPGSALFLVWQQRRQDRVTDGSWALGRDLGALFDADPENVFVVKASFWLGG